MPYPTLEACQTTYDMAGLTSQEQVDYLLEHHSQPEMVNGTPVYTAIPGMFFRCPFCNHGIFQGVRALRHHLEEGVGEKPKKNCCVYGRMHNEALAANPKPAAKVKSKAKAKAREEPKSRRELEELDRVERQEKRRKQEQNDKKRQNDAAAYAVNWQGKQQELSYKADLLEKYNSMKDKYDQHFIAKHFPDMVPFFDGVGTSTHSGNSSASSDI